MSAETRLPANFCRRDPVARDFLVVAMKSERPGQVKAGFRRFGQSAVNVSVEAGLLTFLTYWPAKPCSREGKYYPQKRHDRNVSTERAEMNAPSAGSCWSARQCKNSPRSSCNKINESGDNGVCIGIRNTEEQASETFTIMKSRRILLRYTYQYCRNATVHYADHFSAFVPIEWSSSDAAA